MMMMKTEELNITATATTITKSDYGEEKTHQNRIDVKQLSTSLFINGENECRRRRERDGKWPK